MNDWSAQDERAWRRALGRELKRLRRAPVPPGLLGRLLAVPGKRPRAAARRWLFTVPLAAAAIAVAVAVLVLRPVPEADLPTQAELAAVRDFTVAMHYLQKTVAYTGGEVGGFVSAGLRDAVVVSRNSLLDEAEDENGG